MVPSRHIHMTVKNLPSMGPMLRKRSSSPRGVGTVSRGTAIEEAVGHLKKVNSSLGQYPFALGFIPAKFHGISYPQLYPQSNPVMETVEASLPRRLGTLISGAYTGGKPKRRGPSSWPASGPSGQRGSPWCRMWPRPTSNCAALPRRFDAHLEITNGTIKARQDSLQWTQSLEK